MKVNEIFRLVFLVSIVIYLSFFFHQNKVKAFPVVGVGVIVPVNNYQQCVDTCLAYNGYTSDVYTFCQDECLYTPNVIISGVWVGGRWYPHGEHHRGHDRHGYR